MTSLGGRTDFNVSNLENCLVIVDRSRLKTHEDPTTQAQNLRGAHQWGHATTRLLRRVLRRVLETASKKG